MVYAYDQNMQMPVKDLYDTQMMAMAINAAKDMYEKGLELMDEFNKLYGDFYTPISKDMAAYNSLVIDPYKDAIDRLYANGIDPIRSAEGRAVLARIKNSVPTGKVNALKLSAETAKLYQKALGEAIASGKYDPDVDRFFNPVGLDNWDTLTMGAWDRPAPTTIKTIKEATNDWFKNRSAHDLTPEQMKRAGYAFDPRYNYTGWLYDDLLKTTGDMTPGWLSSLEAKYYRAQAKKQLENAGVKNITSDMVEALLRYNIAEANRGWIMDPTKKADDFAVDDYRTANDIKAHSINAATDHFYKTQLFFMEHPELLPGGLENRQLELSQRILNRIDSNYNDAVVNMAHEYAVANRDLMLKKESQNPGKVFLRTELTVNEKGQTVNKKIKMKDSKFWGKLADDLENGNEVDLKKYGLVDKYGNATQKLRDFALKRFINTRSADLYWKLRSYDPASDIEKEIFRNLYSGTDRTSKFNGTDYNQMSFSSSGIHYAPVRRAGILGLNSTTTKLQKEFDAFLTKNKGLLGYVDNSPNTIANIPVPGLDNITDIYGNVLIGKSDVEKFYNKMKEKDKNLSSLDDVANKLGLHKRTLSEIKVGMNGETTLDREFYVVPIIRSTRITPDDINQQYNHSTYTGTVAAGERNYATEAGLEWLKNN